MMPLESLVPYATSLMMGQKLNVYLLTCIRVVKLELHVLLEFLPQGRNSWDTGMCECRCTQIGFAWAPRTAASEVDKSLPNPVLSLSYLHTHVTKDRDSVLFILPTLYTCLHLSTHTMLHVRSVLHMLFVCFNHAAHTPSLHVHASYLHTLVICSLLHNKKQNRAPWCKCFASVSHAHSEALLHVTESCSIVTIKVVLVALKRKLS